MTTQAVVTNRSRLLRDALRGNAIFSAIGGVAFIVDAKLLAALFGLEQAGYLVAIGVGLLIFAGDLAYLSSRQPIKRSLAYAVVGADVLWVAGSVVLLVAHLLPFTAAGMWIVAALADIVAVFAVLQYIGLRRMAKVG